jgi:REP element-mobilizing transposase RayT
LDEFVVMPNHIHGIIIIKPVGVQHVEPLRNKFQHIIPASIGSIIRSFKGSVTRICRQQGFTNFRWQRNYYERIIRDDNELNRIREYIIDNPAQWLDDHESPTSTTSS